MSDQNSYKDIKIAWLLNSGFYYWHPMLCALTQIFPKTKAFTASWNGFAPGFENRFAVDFVGEQKNISLIKSENLYGNVFTYLPLSIVPKLLEFKPDVIFSNALGLWTLLALIFKPIGKWRVAIAYEGSSPGVDYRNNHFRLLIRRQMVKLADACISNSQAGKSYLLEVLHVSPEKVFVQPYEIPSLISLARNKPREELAKLQHPIFIFIGSTIVRKGLSFLLNACHSLKEDNISNYTLLILGDGEQKTELEAFCQDCDLSESVIWAGRVNYDELGDYLTQADVFILPTLEDTWGVVVSEAMLSGKAVLCSKFAGAKELIEEGANGYIFDPRDVKHLSSLIRKFIDNPELILQMGAKSREIMNQYTPENAARMLAEVTQFVLKLESNV